MHCVKTNSTFVENYSRFIQSCVKCRLYLNHRMLLENRSLLNEAEGLFILLVIHKHAFEIAMMHRIRKEELRVASKLLEDAMRSLEMRNKIVCIVCAASVDRVQ